MTHPLRDQRRCPCAARARMKLIAVAACFVLLGPDLAAAHEVSPQRLTPIVLAVRKARVSVVSIKGQKTVTQHSEAGTTADASDAPRQVNGMGTGTIIDERGYILTNYHVVSDVRRIEVTLDDGRGLIGDLVAYDAAADLAVIKIPASKPLPVIRLGTSADLMVGESVNALGNAFGYEKTVTRRVVSALGRDVQRLRNKWHGLVTRANESADGSLLVTKVEASSPAQQLGIQPGDEILRV